MKAHSLDEHWELLGVEHHVRNERMPWLDRQWYRAALCWLRWRLRRISRRRR